MGRPRKILININTKEFLFSYSLFCGRDSFTRFLVPTNMHVVLLL